MNMNNTDIDARVMKREAKEKCKLIVNSLPKGLKNKVQNEQDYRVPEAKSDIRKLYELVRVKAKKPAIEERALKKANPARKKNERKEQKSSGNHQNKRRAEQNDNRMVKKVKQKKDLDWSQQKGGRSERSATKGAPKEGFFIVVEPITSLNVQQQPQSKNEKLLIYHKKRQGRLKQQREAPISRNELVNAFPSKIELLYWKMKWKSRFALTVEQIGVVWMRAVLIDWYM
ncbi:hypothetical protein PPTG_17046 [Phytophthora nicotianae INRA-310]|uniref:Uncharacterized protein n=1 Tax=Phytophthora nicotianae (strain INRA-310) TaxID=761204 RepID=W2PL51_PHYN3|nr:hypothetical protein PPTG_17046 [Phytophthora nicotianae INRA-310]ETN01587.1 hypothetical protein PPTG_17046 [Phytophthora nicotianae INRA-310]